MIRTIIVDDERLAREGLKTLLKEFSEIEIIADDFKFGRATSKIVGLFRQLNCPVNLQTRSGARQLNRFRRGHSIVSGNVRRCSIESRARDLQIADNSIP